MNSVIEHYDFLISVNNDPVHDPEPLREYMNKWDGGKFIDSMELDKTKSVLEIGVGTGRLALHVAPFCGSFCGIDISPKTIERAETNLRELKNVTLICSNFLDYKSETNFDVIYSSLTFMHFEEKQFAIDKVSVLLNDHGKFVLSIDKNQEEFIDMGTYKIKIFPDKPDVIIKCINASGLSVKEHYETEFAHIIIAVKNKNIASVN